MLLRPTRGPQRVTVVSARAFGAVDHHHGDHHYVKDQVNSKQTDFKQPSQHDIDYQLPKKGTANESIHQWIAGRWAVDRDDVLDNTKYNKMSAYHVWGSTALLRN